LDPQAPAAAPGNLRLLSCAATDFTFACAAAAATVRGGGDIGDTRKAISGIRRLRSNGFYFCLRCSNNSISDSASALRRQQLQFLASALRQQQILGIGSDGSISDDRAAASSPVLQHGQQQQ
jgi:hypothetical protein